MSGSLQTPVYAPNSQFTPIQLNSIMQILQMAHQQQAAQQNQQGQMAQNMAKQQQAIDQSGAVQGPAPVAQASQPGAPPGPMQVTGGGQGPLSTQGVVGNVPFGQTGVPTLAPKKGGGVTKTPGGQNAPGGGNPFSAIGGGGSNPIMKQATQAAQQQLQNPFSYAGGGYTYGTSSGDLATLQKAMQQITSIGTSTSTSS